MAVTATRLCIDTGYPLDGGNYEGPRHCTHPNHATGPACVFAWYVLDPDHGLMTDANRGG